MKSGRLTSRDVKLVGVDVGTTHCKAGLFEADGTAVRIARRPMVAHEDRDGRFYDPGELWRTVASVIGEAASAAGPNGVSAVGIASMAETGLLVDRRTGRPRSAFLPWFDTRAARQAEELGREADPLEHFRKTGLRPSFKYGLAKLLWLREKRAGVTSGAVWLSVADYVAYMLTGRMKTDYSLAARTYAFRTDRKVWDEGWIRHLGFDPGLFPEVGSGGSLAGRVGPADFSRIGLPGGTPVAVAGHDHLCCALAVGAVRPRVVLDSMGTAEALVGATDRLELGEKEFYSGLDFGYHVAKDRCFWLGGVRASGASVEWMRERLSEKPLPYEEVVSLVGAAGEEPTGIFYFPYLSGVGGALIGLKDSHGRGDLLKAVLEGTAYEMESIRRSAERVTGEPVREIVAAGGGTRNRHWLQIKADVSGCDLGVTAVSEAASLGAALAAGIGCGVYGGVEEAVASAAARGTEAFTPDPERHRTYRRLYREGYSELGTMLRKHYGTLARVSST